MKEARVPVQCGRGVPPAVAMLNKLVIVVLFSLALVAAGPARAMTADLSLVLAVDVSASIDDVQFRLQRQGYMRAMESLRVAHEVGALKKDDLARITVDTTVQPKNVTHPTDAKLMLRAIEQLGRLAKRSGVALRQSYRRVAKWAALNCSFPPPDPADVIVEACQ